MMKKKDVDPRQIAYQVMIDNGLKINVNAPKRGRRVRIVVRGDKVSVVPVTERKEVIVARKKMTEASPKTHRIRGVLNTVVRDVERGKQSEGSEVQIYKKLPVKISD